MSQHVYAAALIGVEAFLVQVEVDIAGGLPTFVVVGLSFHRFSHSIIPAACSALLRYIPRVQSR